MKGLEGTMKGVMKGVLDSTEGTEGTSSIKRKRKIEIGRSFCKVG